MSSAGVGVAVGSGVTVAVGSGLGVVSASGRDALLHPATMQSKSKTVNNNHIIFFFIPLSFLFLIQSSLFVYTGRLYHENVHLTTKYLPLRPVP